MENNKFYLINILKHSSPTKIDPTEHTQAEESPFNSLFDTHYVQTLTSHSTHKLYLDLQTK